MKRIAPSKSCSSPKDSRSVHAVLTQIAPDLRTAGFRGSRQNFRKQERDVICIVNFQGSRTGDRFFVNLGAQPRFIPAEGNIDPGTVKEYECVLRTRVGSVWPLEMAGPDFDAFRAVLLAGQDEFFRKALSLPQAVLAEPVDALLRMFTGPLTTEARMALHLARAAVALRDRAKAEALARRGLELAGDARNLRLELNALIASLHGVS